MIKRKTVFIVGAGASAEFQLPTGLQLTKIIAALLNFDESAVYGHSPGAGDAAIFNALQRIAVTTRVPGGMGTLVDRAWRIRDGMHQVKSIDTFLDTHQDDQILVACGKLAIARALLEQEQTCRLAGMGTHRVNWQNVSDTWMHTLWSVIAEGHRKKEIDRIYENIGFIVFNYDRCVEAFLCDGLINQFMLPLSDAAAIANRVRVLHPYGSLGPLPWQPTKGGSAHWLGQIHDGTVLANAAATIQTYSEQMSDASSQEIIHQMIVEAERIVFLGFGFHAQNIDLLSPPVGRLSKGLALATAVGVPVRDRGTIEHDLSLRLCGPNGAGLNVQLHDLGCCAFINDFQRTLIN